MKWHLPSLSQITVPIRNNFRLRKYVPRESTMQILRTLYPEVDWNRVDFYEGLPWFTPAVAPYVTAQALPQFYSFNKFRIYLRKFDETRAQCIADIVHEAFHIMQAMNFKKGYGFGFFRVWMLYYVAVFFRHGYRQNPFEIPAYDQEFRFLKYCEKHNLHGITPQVDEEAFGALSQQRDLVFRKFEFKFRENLLTIPASFLFCTFIALVKPIADALVFVVRFFVPAEKAAQTVKG
jgi:hypothetical protein